MRFLFCLVISVGMLISCSVKKPISGTDISAGDAIPNELIDFLLQFEKDIQQHNRSELLDYLDEQYKKEQLGNLNDNLIQFIDELFCGNEPVNQTFGCIDLEKLKGIELKNLIRITPNYYQATYLITSDDVSYIVTWNITENKVNTFKYGFIGAYG